MQTGTRGRHWLLGTRPGTGTDKEKMRRKGEESKFGRVCGWRETYERKMVNEGIKDELVRNIIDF